MADLNTRISRFLIEVAEEDTPEVKNTRVSRNIQEVAYRAAPQFASQTTTVLIEYLAVCDPIKVSSGPTLPSFTALVWPDNDYDGASSEGNEQMSAYSFTYWTGQSAEGNEDAVVTGYQHQLVTDEGNNQCSGFCTYINEAFGACAEGNNELVAQGYGAAVSAEGNNQCAAWLVSGNDINIAAYEGNDLCSVDAQYNNITVQASEGQDQCSAYSGFSYPVFIASSEGNDQCYAYMTSAVMAYITTQEDSDSMYAVTYTNTMTTAASEGNDQMYAFLNNGTETSAFVLKYFRGI